MLRILIVDDTNLIRQALNICFQAEPDWEIVGTARNGKEAISKIVQFNPDLVVMDMDMPEMDGLTATKIISEYMSRTKVLILSSYSHQNYIERAFQAGASGYLFKSQPVEELPEAIKLIHHHDAQILPDAAGEKSYRVIFPSLAGVKQEQTSPNKREEKAQAETEQKKDAHGNNWSSYPFWTDATQLLAGWKQWRRKSRVSAWSLLGMTAVLTSFLEYETTVKVHAQIRPDHELATSQAPLVAKAFVSAQDIGKIVAEQEVELRVFDCPSTSACTLKGQTGSIAESSIAQFLPEESLWNSHRAYEVRIEPEESELDMNQHPCQLKPGMMAKAHITIQSETLWAMLLRQTKADIARLQLWHKKLGEIG